MKIIIFLFVLFLSSCDFKVNTMVYRDGSVVFYPDGKSSSENDLSGNIKVIWTPEGLTVRLASGQWIWWYRNENKWYDQMGNEIKSIWD